MKKLISFDDWDIDNNTPFGSGASRKHWLINKNNEKGIFKYPKTKNDGTVTNEYWAESLAYDIAVVLNIPCAKVDIGHYNNEIGSMSYMLLEENENLIEGISFISKEYPNYDSDNFCDKSKDTWYSIQMIMESLRDIYLDKEFLKIPIFDCLIGNSDRHHSNWGVVINKDTESKKLSPLYDNGSSLCCLVDEDKIFFHDETWLNGLIYTKSSSMIRFENIKKRPTHFEMVAYISRNFYKDTIGLIYMIKDILKDSVIDALINNYSDEVISPKLKKLLKLFLIMRRDKLIDIFLTEGK